jgi:dihydroneopterin aldolase
MISPDTISIFLRDFRVELPVGVYGHEKLAPQAVTVNIEAEATLTVRFDDLQENTTNRAISYETIYNFVRTELPRLGHIYLLETVAEHIVDFCFCDMRIQRVTVRLEKPTIFQDAIPGISMTRTRASIT